MNTSDPSEVYPGSLLIPPEEAAVIDVKQLSSAKLDDKERLAMLPFRGSRWLEQRLRLALDLPSPAKGRHL
jgi:DNA-directed RNA polymerase I subunit RPA49